MSSTVAAATAYDGDVEMKQASGGTSGATAPKATVPKATAPKATAPKATAPKTEKKEDPGVDKEEDDDGSDDDEEEDEKEQEDEDFETSENGMQMFPRCKARNGDTFKYVVKHRLWTGKCERCEGKRALDGGGSGDNELFMDDEPHHCQNPLCKKPLGGYVSSAGRREWKWTEKNESSTYIEGRFCSARCMCTVVLPLVVGDKL